MAQSGKMKVLNHRDTIRIFILRDTASVNNLNVKTWQQSPLTTECYSCPLEVLSLSSEWESSSSDVFMGSRACATSTTGLPDPRG